MNLWIAKNKNGAIYLFSEEPYSVEGEFHGNLCSEIEIDESLIHGTIDYYKSPMKVTLLIDEENN